LVLPSPTHPKEVWHFTFFFVTFSSITISA
jgi:hypothetical protein